MSPSSLPPETILPNPHSAVAASPEFGVLIPRWFFANQCGRVVLLGLLEPSGFSGSGKKGVTLGPESLWSFLKPSPNQA
jgi:hypothetical protein